MCQVFLHAINMWVSCTPCPNQRNLPNLQVEECPGASNSSRFGWLLSLLEWSVFELRGFFLLEKLSFYFLWVLSKIKVNLPNIIILWALTVSRPQYSTILLFEYDKVSANTNTNWPVPPHPQFPCWFFLVFQLPLSSSCLNSAPPPSCPGVYWNKTIVRISTDQGIIIKKVIQHSAS